MTLRDTGGFTATATKEVLGLVWIKGRDHIKHVRDLETLMFSSARREYSPGNEPPGYIEYWEKYLIELFVVGCLMYLESLFGEDSHWLKSAQMSRFPMTKRRMEAMRCLRNALVHNAGKINPHKARDAQILRSFDEDVRAGQLLEEVLEGKSRTMEPLYKIEPDDSLVVPKIHVVRWATIAYLMAEGEVKRGVKV